MSSISIHMLRNYDKLGLLVPEHVDPLSGYRYYDKEQLVQGNKIVALKSMGFGLEEIKQFLGQNEVTINKLVEAKLIEKQQELRQIKHQIQRLKDASCYLGKEEEYAFSITEKQIPPMNVISYHGIIHEFPQEGILWSTLTKECVKQRLKIEEHACAMAIQHSWNQETNEIEVEVQLSMNHKQKVIEPLKFKELQGGLAASIIFQGSYHQISKINAFVAKWLEANQYEICGLPFSIYHNSPKETESEQGLVTELCFPIQKR